MVGKVYRVGSGADVIVEASQACRPDETRCKEKKENKENSIRIIIYMTMEIDFNFKIKCYYIFRQVYMV